MTSHDPPHGQIEYPQQENEQRLARPAVSEETETALHASAERYRSLVEQAADGIFIADPSGRYVDVNASGCRMIGYSRDELLQKSIADIVIPAEIERIASTLEAIKQGQAHLGEWRFLRKDGSTFPGEVSAVQISDGSVLGFLRDITERKNLEEMLKHQNARLREQSDLLELAYAAILVRDMHDRITYWNHAAEETYGWSKAEAQGEVTHTLLQTQFPQPLQQITAALYDSGRWEGELVHTRRDGTTLVVESRWALLRDEQGQPVATLEINRDITARKRAEEALLESEARTRATFEMSADGIITIDERGSVHAINPAATRFFGYAAEEVVGQNITLLMPEPDRSRHDDYLAHYCRTGEKHIIGKGREVVGRRKDGSVFPLELSVGEMWLQGQRLFVGSLRDITARKQAEMALKESEERFRLLVDNLPAIIWMTDASGANTFVNRAWREFTGRSEEAARSLGWKEDIHPEDCQIVVEAFRRTFLTQKPHYAEFRLRRRDGQYRWIADIGVPRFLQDGTFVGYIGSGIDITDQKRMQEQLFEASKLESLGRLAGGVAHDFNNLLMAITGYTELAQNDIPAQTPGAQYLENISVAAERATALTQQLLMYARRQMVEFTSVNLNEVIRKMVPLLQRTLGEAYELKLDLAKRVWNVQSNASQMEQVLLNLVINARDAMPKGGSIAIETADVTLDAEYAAAHIGVMPGEYVLLAISDHGMGMLPEVQEHIFEPFFTTKTTGKGTGLGLATCYGIVKQSHGNIWVYSEPDRGTTFKVYLPRLKQAVIMEEATIPENLSTGTETILLVDDEPMVRDVVARILRGQGYRILEAGNGVEALHVQSEWKSRVDLIITDVVMPVMGGKELLERLRQLQPDIKVLYMSGYTHNVILRQGVLNPDVMLIIKPFTSAALVTKVREVLNGD